MKTKNKIMIIIMVCIGVVGFSFHNIEEAHTNAVFIMKSTCYKVQHEHSASCYLEGNLDTIICEKEEHVHNEKCFSKCAPRSLTWEELQQEENGLKYGYNSAAITDTELSDGAFYYCQSVSEINIPDGVMVLGNNSITGCSNLVSVVVPDSVIEIGENCFDNCEALELENVISPAASK